MWPLREKKSVLCIIFTSITFISSLAGRRCPLKKSPKRAPLISFYSLKAQSIDGKTVSMEQFKGKYVLIVNTASKCRYTKQYEALEALFQQHKELLVVLGFPSNDFLQQEPGSNGQIKQFCSIKYGITFPLFAKIKIKGDQKHPVYQWLTDPEQNGWNSTQPSWNFNKYLIDPQGKLLAHFGSKIDPLSPLITDLLK